MSRTMQYTVPYISFIPKVKLFTKVTDYPILEELIMKISKQEVLVSWLAF